jgi:5-methylcytosine-specific restriction enzyme A
MAEWTDHELRAAVVAYREMQKAERAGRPVNKKEVYRDLASRFGRTEKAFEYRMQNISAVLALIGREWVPGLKPATHVGANVVARLERVLSDVDGVRSSPVAALEAKTRELAAKPQPVPPPGTREPAKEEVTVTSYARDPAVRAWVLQRSKGVCELCECPAPFVSVDGTPFLEVHHLLPLAEGGSDRPSNAVALCPNCHRELHYGRDAGVKRTTLLATVPELKAEG